MKTKPKRARTTIVVGSEYDVWGLSADKRCSRRIAVGKWSMQPFGSIAYIMPQPPSNKCVRVFGDQDLAADILDFLNYRESVLSGGYDQSVKHEWATLIRKAQCGQSGNRDKGTRGVGGLQHG